MTLVYRSVFSDSDGRICQTVDDLFGRWLKLKDLEIPDDGLSSDGTALLSASDQIAWAQRREIVTATTEVVRRLRLVEEADAARWVTTIVWGDSTHSARLPGAPAGWVWVDLEHETVGSQHFVRPGSPRLVRELLAAGEAQDGSLPLTSDVWEITGTHVEELIRYATDVSRHVPIIVFAYDGQRAYNQPQLASRLARDLAGIAVVFRLVDGAATERFASLMPEGYAVYGGAMRTYLPGVGTDDDLATRHRVLGRASLVALGPRAFPAVKDQILELSTTRTAPFSSRPGRQRKPAWTVDRTLPRTMPEATSLTLGWVRSRLDRLRSKWGMPTVGEDTATLAGLHAAFEETIETVAPPDAAAPGTAPLEALQAAAEARQQVELMEQLLDESDRESTKAGKQFSRLRSELEEMQLEATEAVEQVDRSQRRARWLEKRLRHLGDVAIGVDDSLPEAPPSVAETLILARQHLPFLEIFDTDESAAALDLHAGAQLFAIKTWNALIALNAYAEAACEGTFHGSFYSWCQEPPGGEHALPATTVAMTESESVESNPSWREARIFRVPDSVAPSGQIYMPAHVKIVKRGAPAPRLHFYDDTTKTGKVLVGYLGAHLPTARFH